MADEDRIGLLETELAALRKRVDAIDDRLRPQLRVVQGGSRAKRSPVTYMLSGASMRSRSNSMPTHEEICRQLAHPLDVLGYSLSLAGAAMTSTDLRVKWAAYVIGETALMIEERGKKT